MIKITECWRFLLCGVVLTFTIGAAKAEEFFVNQELLGSALESEVPVPIDTFVFPTSTVPDWFHERALKKRHQVSYGNLEHPKLAEGISAINEGRYSEALQIFKHLAEEEAVADAFNKIGFMYVFGLGVKPDKRLAINNFSIAAHLGSDKALNNLAAISIIGNQLDEIATQLSLDRKYPGGTVFIKIPEATHKNDDERQNALTSRFDCANFSKLDGGIEFVGGFGRTSFFTFINPFEIIFSNRVEDVDPQNSCSETASLFTLSANRGNVHAMYNLGVAYRHGLGVDQDFKEAFKWFSKAAELELAEAYNALGVELYLGRGAPRDALKAVEYFSVATLLGVPNASHNLGVAFYEGYGVKKNKSEAYRLIRIAAEQGDLSARKALGWDKLPNPDGPSSFKEAREWLENTGW